MASPSADGSLPGSLKRPFPSSEAPSGPVGGSAGRLDEAVDGCAPSKRRQGTSSPAWFLPSSEVAAELEGVDSGFSDGTTPPASCEDSQESFPASGSSNRLNHSSLMNQSSQQVLQTLDESVDLNLPPEACHDGDTLVELPGGDHNDGNGHDNDDDDDDRLSSISGLSDLSGRDWKPMAGPFSWVQRQMISGADPRALLKDMLSCDAIIPQHLDQLTLWKSILNMLSEPPRRKKLDHVNTIQDVVGLIRKSTRIIVLTGAGVSVSCGIPDFRSRDGVYARLAVDFPDLPDPQAMFDIHYFRKDPRPFFKFAREIYPGQFQPSPCHKFIKCVERHGKLLKNYTQNIDTLEQVVGIENVVQCHGSFATATCMRCRHKVKADAIKEDIFQQRIPKCLVCPNLDPPASEEQSDQQDPSSRMIPGSSSSAEELIPGIMKPDIVFFGEGLGDEFHNAVAKDKDQVDLLIMIGSSLKVRPVALIPSSIDPSIPQVLINREPLPHLTPDVELLGDCDGIINQICHMLGQGWEDVVHKPTLAESLELVPVKESEQQPCNNVETVEKPEKPAQEPDEKIEASKDPLRQVDAQAESHSKISRDESKVAAEDQKHKQDPQQECQVEKPDDEAAKEVEETQDKHVDSLRELYMPRVRQSIAHRLQNETYLFVPPSRYVFPGAEVFENDDDDDNSSVDDNSDADSSISSNDDRNEEELKESSSINDASKNIIVHQDEEKEACQ